MSIITHKGTLLPHCDGGKAIASGVTQSFEFGRKEDGETLPSERMEGRPRLDDLAQAKVQGAYYVWFFTKIGDYPEIVDGMFL